MGELMESEKIVCPKCKGCGAVSPLKKRIMDIDPINKWCPKCKTFLLRDKFYNKTPYCKDCHKTLARERKEKNPDWRLKYESICKVCDKGFLGYKKLQNYCSRRCNCLAMNRSNNRHINTLSNELIDQMSEETNYY